MTNQDESRVNKMSFYGIKNNREGQRQESIDEVVVDAYKRDVSVEWCRR